MKSETRIKKRVVSILMIIAMICSGVFVSFVGQTKIARAAKSDEIEDYEEDEKDEESYIEITNVSELYAIRNNLDGKYRLMNDIDLTKATAEGGEVNNTGHGWDPIEFFSGELDGNGHVIKGMKIYGEVEGNAGLFGTVSGALIQNLGMVDVDIDVKGYGPDNYWIRYNYGAIIGTATEQTKIKSCFVTGTIKAIGANSTGGVVGASFSSSSIDNSYNLADVCSVDSEGNYQSETAGLVGDNYLKINQCYNAGKINNGEGIAIAAGAIAAGDKDINCFYLKGTGEEGAGAGTPLTETQMKNVNYFTGWDFDAVWEIDPYSNYKYPQLKSCLQKRVKSLVIDTPPEKVEYNQGEPLDIAGATVKVTYEDGLETTIFLTEDMLGDYNMMSVGKQRIPVKKGNATTSLVINVNGIPVTNVAINKTSTSIYKGYTEQLSASVQPETASNKGIEWSSDDETIATVSQDGTVTGKNPGTTVIRATSQDGAMAECMVTVTVPCVILQLDSYDITINKGDTYVPIYKMSPVDSTDTVKWISSDEKVVHVDDKNQLIGVSAGVVTVTGITESGISTICTVTVMQDISEFTVLNIKDKNYTGKPRTQKPEVTNGTKTLRAGVDYTVEYSSNVNVGKATVKIIGLTPYKGTLTKEFNILPVQGNSGGQTNSAVSLSKAKISSIKASKKKLIVQWKRVKNASGYFIDMAKNRAFTKSKKTYSVGENALRKTLKGAKKTTYYVRIRAYTYDLSGQICYGGYSKVIKKKTK